MRITKHKGRPKGRVEWNGLDEAIEKLGVEEHLKVFPGREVSAAKLRQKILQRYEGIEAKSTRTYVTVSLKES